MTAEHHPRNTVHQIGFHGILVLLMLAGVTGTSKPNHQLHFEVTLSSSSKKAFSSSTLVPRRFAVANLDPGDSPATR
jgi:hypothetical protein